MTKAQLKHEALQLPVEEQLEIAEAIWERLESAVEQPPIPDWRRQLFDERIAEDDADPEGGSPWEEVKHRILASL